MARPKRVRNFDIVARSRAMQSHASIAVQHNISVTRVGQIVREHDETPLRRFTDLPGYPEVFAQYGVVFELIEKTYVAALELRRLRDEYLIAPSERTVGV